MNLKKRRLAIGVFLLTMAICIGVIIFLHNYKSNMTTLQIAIVVTVMLIAWALAQGFMMKSVFGTGEFYCQNCQERIETSALKYFLTIKSVDKVYLKCPKCKKYRWCKQA